MTTNAPSRPPARIQTAAVAATLALALLAPRPAHPAASEWSKNPQSQVRLVTAWKVAPRSGEMWMGLQFRLSPEWHVYWKNSGDAGFPPSIVFHPEERIGQPELLWPTPHRFDLPGGLVAFGYADEVVYPVRAEIRPAPEATPSPEATSGEPESLPESLTLTADLDYLVCQADCVPYRYTLTVEQPVGDAPEPDPETAPLVQSWIGRLPRLPTELAGVTTGAVVDAGRGRQGGPDLEVRVLGARGQAGTTDLFLETSDLVDAGRPRMRLTPDGVVFHVPLKPKDVNKPLPARLPLAWTVSGLVVAKDGKPANLEARRDVEVWTGAGAPPAAGGGEAAAPPSAGLPRLLLQALAGGLLLDLMPPVFALLLAELLALRAAGGLGGASGAREGAAAATTGVVGGAWIAAALALAAHRAGAPAGWGAQLQEPFVGALLAVAAAVLALNLWGVVEVPLAPVDPIGPTDPSDRTDPLAPARTRTIRHLLAGLFTVPLALAWPVPPLREPLAYALSRGPAAVAGFFAVVGFGLALPYLLVAVAPALLRALPDPEGRGWLPRLREGLGFLAAAGALWVLYALSRQVSPVGLAGVEIALLALSLFAWLRHRRPRQGGGWALRAAFALGLLVCAAGAPWFADRNRLEPRPAAPTTLDGLPHATREPDSNPIQGG